MQNNKFNSLFFVMLLAGLLIPNAHAADPNPRPLSLAQEFKVNSLIANIRFERLDEDKIDEQFHALGAIDSQEVKDAFAHVLAWQSVKAVNYFLRKGFNADEALIMALEMPLDISIFGKRGVGKYRRRCIQEILNFGANPNGINAQGSSCLTIAIYLDAQVVDMLIDRGADVRKAPGGGYTPLHTVVFSPLNHASKRKMVQSLIDNKADIEATTDPMQTPLLTACTFGEMDMASFLVELGADKNFGPPDGRSALFWACCSRNLEPCTDLSFLLPDDAQQRKAQLLRKENNPLRLANETHKFRQLADLLVQLEKDGGSSAKAIKDFDLLKKGAVTLACRIERITNEKNSRPFVRFMPSAQCSTLDMVHELSFSCKENHSETECQDKFHYCLLRDFMKKVLKDNDEDESIVATFHDSGNATQHQLLENLYEDALKAVEVELFLIHKGVKVFLIKGLAETVMSYVSPYWYAPCDSNQNSHDEKDEQ